MTTGSDFDCSQKNVFLKMSFTEFNFPDFYSPPPKSLRSLQSGESLCRHIKNAQHITLITVTNYNTIVNIYFICTIYCPVSAIKRVCCIHINEYCTYIIVYIFRREIVLCYVSVGRLGIHCAVHSS